MRVVGKIYSLKDYFRAEFANTKNVYSGTGPDFETGNIVFTDNGFWDLEKEGNNGYGVWVGLMHDSTGGIPEKYFSVLKDFVECRLVPAFEKYVGEHGGNVENIIVESKIAITDCYRIYYIDSIAKED